MSSRYHNMGASMMLGALVSMGLLATAPRSDVLNIDDFEPLEPPQPRQTSQRESREQRILRLREEAAQGSGHTNSKANARRLRQLQKGILK